MQIKVNSQIYISNPTKDIIDYCKKKLTIKNPELQKKKAMGFYARNIPPQIRMYSVNDNTYILPIGTIDDVWKIDSNIQDYDICFGSHEKLEFPETSFKLYDYQEKAVEKMLKVKRGILESKCGTGKSIMGLEIIRRIGYKALIIVQTKEILDQFKSYLEINFNMKKGDFGIIASGKVEIGKYITIALRQTLVNIDLQEYKFEWGTILVDEVQNCAGSVTKVSQYQKILNSLASEYRIGLSATAYRVDGLTPCLYALMNVVKYRVDESCIQDKIMKAKIYRVNTAYEIPFCCQKYDGTINYTSLPTNLATNQSRNKLIIQKLKEEKDNYCLILSDRLDGLKILQQSVGGLLIDGKMISKKAKEERQKAVEKMRNKEEHYLFATYSLAREGLDIKPLNRLFLVAPTKNKISIIQSVGRIERKAEGKKDAKVYDFVDNDIYFDKAWKDRKTIYKKNGNIIIDN